MLVFAVVHRVLNNTVGCFAPLELVWCPYILPQPSLAQPSLPTPKPTCRLLTGPAQPVPQGPNPQAHPTPHSISPPSLTCPLLLASTRSHILPTNQASSVCLTSFYLSHFCLLGLTCLYILSYAPAYSVHIRPRSNNKSPHTQVSLQKYKQYERSSQMYFTSKPSSVEMLANENYPDEPRRQNLKEPS